MNKPVVLMGIILIIMINMLIASNSIEYKFMYEYCRLWFILNIMQAVIALCLISLYDYWLKREYKINETIYLISTVISGTCLILIFNLSKKIIFAKGGINFLSNYKDIASVMSSMSFMSTEQLMYKYMAIFTALVVMIFFINAFEKAENKNNKGRENIINSYNYELITDNQQDITNEQYNVLYDEKTVKIKSITSGIKAGFIIILCQAVFGLLVVLYPEILPY